MQRAIKSLSDLTKLDVSKNIFLIKVSYGEFLTIKGYSSRKLRQFMLSRFMKRIKY